MPNTTIDTAPVAANAAASNLAIGEPTRSRANLSRGAGQAAQATGPDANASSDASSSSGTKSSADAKSADAKSAAPTDGAAANATPSADKPTAAATTQFGQPNSPGVTTPAPADSTASQGANSQAIAAVTTPRTDAGTAAAPGDSASQTASNIVKAASAALPSFGIVAANAATAQSVPATSGTTTTAAVPISGLPIAIASRALAGSNQFDIRLDPPELGRIDVQLNVSANGQVTSHVTVDRPETLTLLQSQQPQLERALEQAGLKTADNGLQFTLRDQSFAGGDNGGSAQPSPAQQLVVPDTDLPPVDATQIYSRWGRGTGVDITV